MTNKQTLTYIITVVMALITLTGVIIHRMDRVQDKVDKYFENVVTKEHFSDQMEKIQFKLDTTYKKMNEGFEELSHKTKNIGNALWRHIEDQRLYEIKDQAFKDSMYLQQKSILKGLNGDFLFMDYLSPIIMDNDKILKYNDYGIPIQ